MNKYPEQIILFDGVCNLCNGAVQFVSKRYKKKVIHFASLQSGSGRELLLKYGLSTTDLDTFVYIRDQKCYTRSAAALMVLNDLGGIWKMFGWLKVFPEPVLDFFYKLIARNRFRIFGKKDHCNLLEIE